MLKKNVGILGIGAIGSVISILLKDNKNLELGYFNRSVRKVVKIKRADVAIDMPIRCHTSVELDNPLDWLIICLKEYHFTKAKTWLKKLIDPSTKVAVIRNGLQLKEPILPFTTAGQILECMIDCPTQPGKDGYYQQFYPPTITVTKGDLATSFLELFHNLEVTFKFATDFNTENWKKVCESSALGAILCLTGETCWIFKDEKVKKLYQTILEEAVAVAKADGANIEPSFVADMLVKLMTYAPTKGSSMLTDKKNGHPIELGAKNGVISKIALDYGIATPVNDLICVLLSKTNSFS
ncbi:MAG: 2-dehydropantoate 2-reductase [Saprospiraceae bacterium]|nr:MAG: 2-dehydropantoate 2-reductase [Saprospiraceae bacterium]